MPISRQGSLSNETAEMLAIQALGFIGLDEERLGRFLAVTGIGPAEIRDAAREPHFLAGVLDYLAADETLLLGFATQAGVDPSAITLARKALGSRDMP